MSSELKTDDLDMQAFVISITHTGPFVDVACVNEALRSDLEEFFGSLMREAEYPDCIIGGYTVMPNGIPHEMLDEMSAAVLDIFSNLGPAMLCYSVERKNFGFAGAMLHVS